MGGYELHSNEARIWLDHFDWLWVKEYCAPQFQNPGDYGVWSNLRLQLNETTLLGYVREAIDWKG